MTRLFDKCFEFFKTKCLYEVLGVDAGANKSDVKKGYYRMSLKVHPDRATETFRQLATQQFQILGKVYSILSDTEKRAVYDETGTVDEDGDAQSDKDWESYWRLLFKKITPEDIEKFKQEYQGSEEEIKDLKYYYEYYKGDMDKIMECVPCSEIEEEPRLRKILLNGIKQNELKDYSSFSKEKKSKQERRKKRYAKEAEEAEETIRELGLKVSNAEPNSLETMIMQRQQEREKQADDFFASLEAKYGGKKPKKGKQENGTRKDKSPARPKQTGTKRKR